MKKKVSTAHTMRYDVFYDKADGRIVSNVCNCSPSDGCQFTDNWIADGKPTHVPIQYQEHRWEDFFEAGMFVGFSMEESANFAERKWNELLVREGIR